MKGMLMNRPICTFNRAHVHIIINTLVTSMKKNKKEGEQEKEAGKQARRRGGKERERIHIYALISLAARFKHNESGLVRAI